MRLSKTALKELTSRYRDILRKCAFLNILALGVFAATAANAADTTYDPSASVATNLTGLHSAINGTGTYTTELGGTNYTIDQDFAKANPKTTRDALAQLLGGSSDAGNYAVTTTAVGDYVELTGGTVSKTTLGVDLSKGLTNEYAGTNYISGATTMANADVLLDAKIKNISDGLGTAAATDIAGAFSWDHDPAHIDAAIGTWVANNTGDVATVDQIAEVLGDKFTVALSDLAATGNNSASIAHLLGGTTTSDTAISRVQALADGQIADSIADTTTAGALGTLLNAKQTALDTDQLAAVNSGITSDLVAQIGTNTTAIAGKQDALSAEQIVATQSGITAERVTQIGANQTAIANEIGRATAAEAGLNTRLTTAEGKVDTNTTAITTINTTLSGYGDIVTHDADEFATAAQGATADATAAAVNNAATGLAATKAIADQNKTDIGTINTTLGTYGDIVTHDADEFATAAQGATADATAATIATYGDIVTHDADEFATAAQGATADATAATIATYGDIVTHNVSEFDAAGSAATAKNEAIASAKDYTDAETTRAKGVEGLLADLGTTDKSTLVAAINEVKGNATANTTAIGGLDTRLTAAETAITAEANRAKGVEGTLGDLSTTDKSTLVAAINEVDAHADANAEAITAEANRAKGVEGTLTSLTTEAQSNLVAAINEVDAHADANAEAITAEANRAKGVEGTLTSLTTDAQSNLVAAINEVDAHADANAEAITAEANRAKGVEGTLGDLVTTDKSTLVAAINEVKGNANTNAAAIVTEKDRATAAEEALDGRLTTAEAAIVTNATAISDETIRATAAEGELNTAITNEVTRATGAEAALNTAITNEVARATGVEDQLREDLTAETNRAMGVETGLRTDLGVVTDFTDSETGNIAKNGANATTVTKAIAYMDETMGQIRGLADKVGTGNGGDNLAQGDATVEGHLTALAGSIGDRTQLQGEYVSNVSVAQNLQSLNDGLENEVTRATNAETALGDRITALSNATAEMQAGNNARFDRVEKRINKLEDKLEKGLAANNALAGLVPLDHEYKTQISAALGGYKDNQALAVGAFHYINERTLLNAGAAYGGNSNVSYKVGVTFGF